MGGAGCCLTVCVGLGGGLDLCVFVYFRRRVFLAGCRVPWVVVWVEWVWG